MDISTIMIVDDSEPDQFLTQMAVEEYDPGITIMQAYDGEEALGKLDSLEKQPDVIFLDINMPRMNGLEFLAEYNKRDEKATVITMLTSSEQEKDKQEAMSYDFVKDYYVKLLEKNDLMALSQL